jgi:formylglycine-generating enzyme required for sulfatase activity/cell division protein FtsB
LKFYLSIFLIFSTSLFGKAKDIDSVISSTISQIDAKSIDNDSLEYDDAVKIFDDINLKLEEEKSSFKSKTLKLSIDASYLHRSIKEKEKDINGIQAIIKRKEAKVKQLNSDIEAEKNYISQLNELIKKRISFNSNISTQGYLFAFVEDKRSVSRDKFIEIAVEGINREAIEQLNGIFVETLSKFDRELSMKIRETSSGTAISDSSETTIKLFFSNSRSNSVMIYGTKVDVYPFESGEVISKHKRKDFGVKYITLIRDGDDIERVIEQMRSDYPKMKLDSESLRKRVQLAIESIDSHNKKSRDVILDIDKNHKEFVKKISKRIESRDKVLKVLESHRDLVKNEIGELSIDLNSMKLDKQVLEDKFALLQHELISLKRTITFKRAEMDDRRHSNAVKETKAIVKELLLDIDKSLLKTSKSMETVFNGSSILKDIVNEVEYEKIYVEAKTVPYFIRGTDRTGALVTLEIQFNDKKLPKETILDKNRFVKIEGGEFRFGSNSGDGDERPEIKMSIDKSFYIGKYEVTIGEYMEFADEVKSHYPEWKSSKKGYDHACFEDNCPVVGITWKDATAYAEWLSKKKGEKFRLPTEFEWEFVAKGDLNLQYGFLYGNLKDYSWFYSNSGGEIHPVGQKKPNLFGVYDMSGNVWEFCSNSYNYNYRVKRFSKFKSMRGGDWKTKEYFLRSANRAKYPDDRASSSIGFRLVKE